MVSYATIGNWSIQQQHQSNKFQSKYFSLNDAEKTVANGKSNLVKLRSQYYITIDNGSLIKYTHWNCNTEMNEFKKFVQTPLISGSNGKRKSEIKSSFIVSTQVTGSYPEK